MTDTRPTFRETLENDPLGITKHFKVDDADQDLKATPAQQRAALLRMLAVVAAGIAFGFVAGVGETVLVVIGLILCVVAHEFGHYIAAKTGGVKVTEFFVGFGPKLWSIRRGETEYGVKGFPLGGYCRIIGMNNLEEVAPADELRTYRQAPLWRRLLIDVAGPAMNLAIGVVVLFAMFFWTGDDGSYVTSIPASNPVVRIVAITNRASPAELAGFELGDRIVAVDGTHVATWNDLTKIIKASAGKTLDFTVERAGKDLHLRGTPAPADTLKAAQGVQLPAGKVGFMGFATSPLVHSGFGLSVSRAGGAWTQVSAGTFSTLGKLVSLHGVSSYFHMLGSQKAADSSNVRLASPISVVRVLNQASQAGLAHVLWLVAAINIFLGLFNLLPLFPLDGARIAIGLYEGLRGVLRRRPYRVDMMRLLPAFYAGLALVFFLGFTAIFLDIRDLAA